MTVTTAMMMTIGLVMVALVVPMVRPNAKKRAFAKAKHTKDPTALVEYVESRQAMSQADAWNQTLDELWRKYEREMVAMLLLEALPRCDAKILQYWTSQVLQLEPEIAKEIFNPVFLSRYYSPDVASQCGRCGCKG